MEMERVKRQRRSNEDRISVLPEHILLKILSCLPPNDAMATAVLSKAWRYVWIGLPYLDLGKTLLQQPLDKILSASGLKAYDKQKLRDKLHIQFVKFVDQMLISRSKHQHPNNNTGSRISIKVLNLYMPNGLSSSSAQKMLDRWTICAVNDFQLEELNFYNDNGHLYDWTGKAVIPCFSLKQLTLGGVRLEQKFMEGLATICPSLEMLCFEQCYRYEPLKLSGLSKLDEFLLHEEDRYSAIKLVIDAPNLRSLDYQWSYQWRGYHATLVFPIEINNAVRMRYLRIYQAICPGSPELLALFSNVEELVLKYCSLDGDFVLSSTCLKSLYIRGCNFFKGFEIDAPNLKCFKSDASIIPSFLPSCWPIEKVRLKLGYSWTVSGLVDLLTMFNACEELELHYDHSSSKEFLTPLRDSQILLYNLNHLKLKIGLELCYWKNYGFNEMLGSLLGVIPHPQKISVSFLRRSFKVDELKFLKFKYFKQGENGVKKCNRCESLPIKCWQHHLQEVTIENYKGADGYAKNYQKRCKARAEDDEKIKAFFQNAREEEKIVVNITSSMT